MSNIEGKVIAITGASSGIGEATARHLAKLGAKVVLGARRTDRLETIAGEIRADGGTAEFKALDVTNRENVEAFVQFADKTFGKVDVIVNNAGLMPLSPMEALKVDEWDRMVDVNIKGVLYGIAAGLPIKAPRLRAFRQHLVRRGPRRLPVRRRVLRHEVCRGRSLRGASPGEQRHPRDGHLAGRNGVRTRRYHHPCRYGEDGRRASRERHPRPGHCRRGGLRHRPARRGRHQRHHRAAHGAGSLTARGTGRRWKQSRQSPPPRSR
jgi:NAD(P)-dependent dehydrogenase (short-subunit alcohol dehydrogenase family)